MSSDAISGTDDEWGPDSVDALVVALSNEQARGVIEFFQGSGAQVVSREALAEHLHEMAEPAKDQEQVVLRLDHVTLPKLEDVGLIEYDRQGQTISYRATDRSEWAVRFLTLRDELS